MTDNALLAVVVVSIVAGCTAPSIAEKFTQPDNPVTACVKKAWSQTDRIQCLQAKP